MNSIEVIFLILFIVFDLIVTAARTGILNVRHARLLSLQVQPDSTAADTLELISSRAKLRASLKLTQNLLRLLMAGLILNIVEPWGFVETSTLSSAGILILLAFVIWFIESLVEWLVLRTPEVWALRLTPLARTLTTVLSPLVVIPSRIAGVPDTDAGMLVTVTEDELKLLVDASQKAGVLESDESQMIHSIFDFGDTLAREIMIPRIDIFSLEVNVPLEDAADMVLKSGFSRVPVYEGQIDNILGILYTKDMLTVWRDGNQTHTLQGLIRPANFIPEAKKVDDLLAEMQKARNHIAIVVDEFGGVAGLVTLEDIVEEIFGEIQDEYDEGEELPHEKIAEGEYLFLGRIELDEFNEIMGSHLLGNGSDTLGGLIYSRFGRVPEIGEILMDGNLQLTVQEVGRHRIQKVRARMLKPSDKNLSAQQEESHAD